MSELTELDPCAILDQNIQRLTEEMETVQLEIDTQVREWVSLSLLEMAYKQAGVKRNPGERKQMTVRRVESKTQARTLACKVHDLSRQMQALLALKDKLNEPEIARQITALGQEAVEISTCPD